MVAILHHLLATLVKKFFDLFKKNQSFKKSVEMFYSKNAEVDELFNATKEVIFGIFKINNGGN